MHADVLRVRAHPAWPSPPPPPPAAAAPAASRPRVHSISSSAAATGPSQPSGCRRGAGRPPAVGPVAASRTPTSRPPSYGSRWRSRSGAARQTDSCALWVLGGEELGPACASRWPKRGGEPGVSSCPTRVACLCWPLSSRPCSCPCPSSSGLGRGCHGAATSPRWGRCRGSPTASCGGIGGSDGGSSSTNAGSKNSRAGTRVGRGSAKGGKRRKRGLREVTVSDGLSWGVSSSRSCCCRTLTANSDTQSSWATRTCVATRAQTSSQNDGDGVSASPPLLTSDTELLMSAPESSADAAPPDVAAAASAVSSPWERGRERASRDMAVLQGMLQSLFPPLSQQQQQQQQEDDEEEEVRKEEDQLWHLENGAVRHPDNSLVVQVDEVAGAEVVAAGVAAAGVGVFPRINLDASTPVLASSALTVGSLQEASAPAYERGAATAASPIAQQSSSTGGGSSSSSSSSELQRAAAATAVLGLAGGAATAERAGAAVEAEAEAEAQANAVPLLRLEGVCKVYGRRVAVDDVCMEIRASEVVGLLGPNGAGKSSTFNIISGREAPTRGSVWLHHHEITRLPLDLRARQGISYLPQEASVFRGLSVRDNIRVVLQETGVPRREQAGRVEALLSKFGLERVAHTPGRLLSGGERRRTELARALAVSGGSSSGSSQRVRVLLVDEPFAGVDPIGVQEIQDLLETLRREDGLAIFITDHNVRETLQICDRAYMMYKGRLMASGTPSELCANPYVVERYLGRRFAPQSPATPPPTMARFDEGVQGQWQQRQQQQQQQQWKQKVARGEGSQKATDSANSDMAAMALGSQGNGSAWE